MILPVCGGGDGREARSLRRKVGRMKKLLWLRPSPCMGLLDTEPGVWLTSFQLLDTDGQHEVSEQTFSLLYVTMSSSGVVECFPESNVGYQKCY